MNEFSIETVAETPYLYVERDSAMEPGAIAEAMGGAFGEVWAHMQTHGVAPAGGALSVYYDYSQDRMRFRAGFIVARDDLAAAGGAVMGDVTPAGRVVRATHRGAYSGIRAAYGRMFEFVTAQDETFVTPTWEVYLNDPSQVPEEQLLTELYQALKE